ncbi:MAG: 6-phosphogluconolactonase [Thermoanaerobaculia bacterium]|nr:6-phosphogluconolactonase [Thermoanaerobaculia bacterium]
MTGRGAGPLEVRVLGDAAEAARAAADEIRRALSSAIGERGVALWSLAGGSTPERAYDLLAASPREVDWPRVHLFWGDERVVPPDHPESNYGRLRRRLLDRLPAAPGGVHRIRGELPAPEAARKYEAELRRWTAEPGRPPRLDLALLGVGADGHTASLFPGGRAAGGRWVVATRAPMAPVSRVSLTLPVFARARRILFLVTGAEKAEVVARILAPPAAPDDLPAAAVRPDHGSLLWLLDREAAAALPEGGAGGPAR